MPDEADAQTPLLHDDAMSATPAAVASADPEATEHLFEQEVPEASQSPRAMAVGTVVQTKLGLLVLGVVTVLVLVAAVLDYSTEGDLNYQASALALLVAGVLLLLLLWVVYNAPFNMLKVLRATILNMREVGLQMLSSTKELKVQVKQQKAQIAERNEQLRLQSDLLGSQQIQLTEQQALTNQMGIVSRGLNTTLNSMMKAQTGQLAGMERLADSFSEQIDKAIAGERTALLDTLTGLDEQTERARVAAETSEVLTMQLEKMSEQMEGLLHDLRDAAFEESLEDIVLMADQAGDNGLRDKLVGPEPLTQEERHILHTILVRVDDTLRKQFQVSKERRASLRKSISGELQRCRHVREHLSQSPRSHGSASTPPTSQGSGTPPSVFGMFARESHI